MSIKQLTQPVAWRRFTNKAELNAYLGLPGEPVIDASVSPPVLRVCDGVTPGGNRVGIDESIAGVALPEVVAPVSGAVDVALSPVITASQFNGITSEGKTDTHAASYWEVSAKEDFSTFAYQSGRTTADLTTIDLAKKSITLTRGVKYYARVAYEGTSGNLSKWSAVASFTTKRFLVPEYQLAKLLSSNGGAGDSFGWEVALSGDGKTAIVGARLNDHSSTLSNAGSAYVYVRDASGWVRQARLTASDPAVNMGFGASVSLSYDGNTAVVSGHGASPGGAMYVYVRSGTTWSFQSKVTANDAAAGDNFGISSKLSSDGNTLVIGAYQSDASGADSGAAYIFVRSGTTWTQQAKLKGGDTAAGDYFGHSVGLSRDGNTAIIGAYAKASSTNNYSGAAYVFVRSGTTWTQQARLISADTAGLSGQYGVSVELSGDGGTAVVGSHGHSVNGIVNCGAVYVFVRSGTSWSLQAKLLTDDAKAVDMLGRGVAVSNNGNTVLAGAYGDDTRAENAGSAYLFVREGATWFQAKEIFANDLYAGAYFGFSVALSEDGMTALVSADGEGDSTQVGAAYIFG